MNGTNAKSNAKKSYRYNEVVLLDGKPIHTSSTDAAFVSMCDCPDKYI